MTCINPGNDGARGGCGKWWVDVSYLWDDVDCPECLKLRPTQPAPDAWDSEPLKPLSTPKVDFDLGKVPTSTKRR